jgi:hypothetical protein
MSNLKPIIVTLKKGRHKTQPWTFTVDRPGPQSKETKQERYVTMTTARRGACRVLADVSNLWQTIMRERSVLERGKGGKPVLRPVKFIIDKRK